MEQDAEVAILAGRVVRHGGPDRILAEDPRFVLR